MLQRLHSKVILDYPAQACLYYFIRSFDRKGQGWVRLSMNFLCRSLGVLRQALVRRLKRGRGLFFLDYQIKGDRLFVKYASIKRIKQIVGPVFASRKVDRSTFSNVQLAKAMAYEIAIDRQQAACRKAISQKGYGPKQVFDPKDIQSCPRSGRCEHVRGRKVFLGRHQSPIGASQLKMASSLGRARRTLVRWCQRFDAIQVWRAQALDLPVGKDVYVCYRVSKTGKKMRRHYKRMPNLYLLPHSNQPVRMEASHNHKTVVSPAQQLQTKQQTIDYCLSTKAPTQFDSLTDRLLFHFGKDKLIQLSYAVTCWIKPQLVWNKEEEVRQRLLPLNVEVIASAIERTISDFPEVRPHLSGMIRRLQSNKPPLPPTFLPPGLYPGSPP